MHLVTAMIIMNSALASGIGDLSAFVVVVAACLQINFFFFFFMLFFKVVLIMIFAA